MLPETEPTEPAPPAPTMALVRRSPFEQIHELRQHLEDLDQVANALCKATILPRDMQSPANLKMVLLQGMSMGFDIVQSIRASFVMPATKNQPARVGYYVAGLIALVRASPKCRFFRVDETTAERCRVTCARTDEAEAVIHTFDLTLKQAQDANMDKKWERNEQTNKWEAKVKHPWMASPADMLLWRVCGRAAKATFQDVVFGMATPDDLDDIATAEAMEASGGFAPITIPGNGAAPAPRAAKPPTPDPVDAELVDEVPPDAAQAEPADEGSGDPGWDAFLADVEQLAAYRPGDLGGSVPQEIVDLWGKKLGAADDSRKLNALSPWLGIANRHAAKSKNVSEVAAAMMAAFNERRAQLRGKGGAK